jgi:hypothetical protein
MRPVALPFIQFNYRHVAFRLLVEDSQYNNGSNKGIFFLKSFTDKLLVVAGGKVLTDYKLEFAQIEEKDNEVLVSQGKDYVNYRVDDLPVTPNDELKATIRELDRAYSLIGSELRVTQIQREKWPIQEVNCLEFRNSFFRSAKLEGAFRVFETIYYDWLPPKVLR